MTVPAFSLGEKGEGGAGGGGGGGERGGCRTPEIAVVSHVSENLTAALYSAGLLTCNCMHLPTLRIEYNNTSALSSKSCLVLDGGKLTSHGMLGTDATSLMLICSSYLHRHRH